MNFYELKCKVYIKQDIKFFDVYEHISKYISFCIAKDREFYYLHKSNSFKFYTFDSFYPISKDKIYKKDNLYSFRIRTISKKLADFLNTNLKKNINNSSFLVVDIMIDTVLYSFVKELYTLTPTIITTKDLTYWTIQKNGDINLLIQSLHNNLVKKYITYYKKLIKTDYNFIKSLELKNKEPVVIKITKNSKSIKLFGNKFRIIPNDDELSQKLAFLAIGAGLGEKNSYGGGFCIYK